MVTNFPVRAVVIGLTLIGCSVVFFEKGRAECGPWCRKYVAMSVVDEGPYDFGSCQEANPFTAFSGDFCAGSSDGTFVLDDSKVDLRNCTACWAVCPMPTKCVGLFYEMYLQTTCGDWTTFSNRDDCTPGS